MESNVARRHPLTPSLILQAGREGWKWYPRMAQAQGGESETLVTANTGRAFGEGLNIFPP